MNFIIRLKTLNRKKNYFYEISSWCSFFNFSTKNFNFKQDRVSGIKSTVIQELDLLVGFSSFLPSPDCRNPTILV